MPKSCSHQPTALRHAQASPTRARPRGVAKAMLSAASGLLFSALVACASPPPAPLYQRLGGEAGIEAVVHRTLTRVAQDPRSAHHFKGIKMPFLINSVAKHICLVADGPCVYEGDTMVKTHASLHIKDSEFEFMVTVLREELDAAGVNIADKNELLRRLAPMKHEVVQP
jgi:hemoglobin